MISLVAVARVLILSFSDHGRDPRVHRQIEALRKRHELVAAGFAPPAVPGVRFVDLRPPPAPLAARRSQALGLVRIVARRFERAYWGNRTVRFALARLDGRRFDAVVANDIDTLPLALRVAGSAAVLFDAHEYYPEHFAQERWWRHVMGPHFTHLCATYMPRAAAVTTVSAGLARRYREEVGVEAEVVINAPELEPLEPSRVETPIRLLHHGIADRRRRLDLTIQAMRHLDERFRLDLVLLDDGSGELGRLRALAAGDSRIAFPEPLPMPEIPRFANSYDVGLFLLEPRTFNQLHVLPNKLFEFIQARLAVAIGPSPEMAAVVREWDCGVVADDFTPAALARAVGGLDAKRIAALKQRSHAAAAELTADRARGALVRLTESLLDEPRAASPSL